MKINTLLSEFRNKAGAWQSQPKAYKLLAQLKGFLLPNEWQRLHIAHVHYTIGEGAGELYDECNKLELKYKIGK